MRVSLAREFVDRPARKGLRQRCGAGHEEPQRGYERLHNRLPGHFIQVRRGYGLAQALYTSLEAWTEVEEVTDVRGVRAVDRLSRLLTSALAPCRSTHIGRLLRIELLQSNQWT